MTLALDQKILLCYNCGEIIVINKRLVMKYSSLYDLIKYLENGTKLHIGVLFFGKHGNEKLILPYKHTIHSGSACEAIKEGVGAAKRCFACRAAAIKKAVDTKQDFGGFCINGVYEYTRPVVIDGEVCAVVFIGNILAEGSGQKRLLAWLRGKEEMLETMERDFDIEKCEELGALIESYIHLMIKACPQERTPQDFDPWVENVKGFIEQNLEYDTDISFLAKNFSYNQKYFGRLFKKKTGISLDEYINQRRISRAKHLLRDTEESIINISAKVGFNNVSYFNRTFRDLVGMTPTEWRMGDGSSSKRDN